MQQVILDRIAKPVDNEDGFGGGIGHLHIKNRVVASFGKENLVHFLRADGHGDGIFSGAIHNGRNLISHPQTAGFVLAARGAMFGGDGDIFSHLETPKTRLK